MKRRNATRNAFFTSVLSLLLCVSMLVGTTFAWFTDSVVSGTNTIAAGNLDVELYHGKDQNPVDKVNEGTLLFTDVGGNVIDQWEPGVVAFTNLKVANVGTLALKYQLSVNSTEMNSFDVDGTTYTLADALKVAVVEGGVSGTREAVVAAGTNAGWEGLKSFVLPGVLEGNTTSETYGIVVYWQPNDNATDNLFNMNNGKTTSDGKPLSITLGVNLFATQEMYEDDSFGEDYDKNAWDDALLVTTEADLIAALANGAEKVALAADVVSENGFSVAQDLAINLNGYTMTATGDRAYLFHVTGDADLTVVNGTLVAESTNGVADGTGTSTGASSSIYFDSTGTLTVENVEVQGSVRGGHRAVEVYGGTAVLTNVDITTSYGSGVNSGSGANVTLNDCDITVTGMYSAPYNSVAFSVMGGAEMTINSGNYKLINNNTYATGDTHGGWVGIVMNSGGELIINGGTYTNVPAAGFNPNYERAIIEAENLDPATATVTLLGGIYIPQSSNVVSGYGDVNYPVVNANLIDNGDGTWTAVPEIDGVTLTVVTGYPHLYTDGATNYYVYNAQGLKSLNNWVTMTNTYEKTFNIMADIDAAGYTWEGKSITPNGDNTNGMIFNGNGKTISNLAITNGGLFSLAPNGTYATEPTTIKNITFDNVTVTGTYHTGVVWGQVSGDLVLENVHVKNSNITGSYNVSGLVGSTGEFAIDASVKYVDCSVTNTAITANGAAGGDPTGASAFMGRALGKTSLVFEGDNKAESITYVNKNGLVGGGIYGYTVWAGSGFAGTGTCDTFTNWNGIETASTADELRALAANAVGSIEIVLADDITLGDETTQKGMGAYFPNATKVTIHGNNNTLTLKGQMPGNDWHDQYYAGIIAPNAKVTVKDLTIVTEKLDKFGSAYSADRESVYTIIRGASVLCEGVNFDGGIQVVDDTKFVNCSFEEDLLVANDEGYATNGRFCVFIDFQYDANGECTVDFDGCTFDASGYGCVKAAGDAGAKIIVNVKDCVFNNTCPSNNWSRTTPKYDVKMTGSNIVTNDLGGNTWDKGPGKG